jgi:hypothetical protein
MKIHKDPFAIFAHQLGDNALSPGASRHAIDLRKLTPILTSDARDDKVFNWILASQKRVEIQAHYFTGILVLSLGVLL